MRKAEIEVGQIRISVSVRRARTLNFFWPSKRKFGGTVKVRGSGAGRRKGYVCCGRNEKRHPCTYE